MRCLFCESLTLYAKKMCKKCYTKDWHSRNRDSELKKYKERYLLNKEEQNTKSKLWYRQNPDYHKKYYSNKKLFLKARIRYKDNPNHRLSCILRARLNQALKDNRKSGSAIKDLGCTIDELKKHLESQFQEGMTWENHSRDGWHIDHIRPLASFDLSNREELLKACHYTNLQPLWWQDNLRKRYK